MNPTFIGGLMAERPPTNYQPCGDAFLDQKMVHVVRQGGYKVFCEEGSNIMSSAVRREDVHGCTVTAWWRVLLCSVHCAAVCIS